MCTVNDGKLVRCQPFTLCVAAVKIVYFKAFAVGGQTVVQIEEMFRFITQGCHNLLVDFGGAFIMADIGCDKDFAMCRIQCRYIGKTHEAIVGLKRYTHLPRMIESDINDINSGSFVLASQPTMDTCEVIMLECKVI